MIAILPVFMVAVFAGYITGMLIHWREWRDIFRTRRWLNEGRSIERQFDFLNEYRGGSLDPRVGSRANMTNEERTSLDADVARWLAASEETQRQYDEWRSSKP